MRTKIVKKILPCGIVRLLKKGFEKETHINRALRSLNGRTYVEIGVAEGRCFRQIKAQYKIAVDPSPAGFDDNLPSGESLFKMESDMFFTDFAKKVFKPCGIDIAFIDGLHEFPQALRDIVNLEKYMSPRGVIFIHDMNPCSRDIAEGPNNKWTGDVWKIAYFLSTCRPDLHFFTLDTDWGLGVLTGFRSSADCFLPSADDVNSCSLLDYSFLEQNRKKILRLRPNWYSRFFFSVLHPCYIHRTLKEQKQGDN